MDIVLERYARALEQPTCVVIQASAMIYGRANESVWCSSNPVIAWLLNHSHQDAVVSLSVCITIFLSLRTSLVNQPISL